MPVDNGSGANELGNRRRTVKVLSVLAVLIGAVAAVAQCYQYLSEGRFSLVLAAVFTLLAIIGIAALFAVKDRRGAVIGAILMTGVIIATVTTVNILGEDVAREAVGTPSANPFMPPVGTDEPDVPPPPSSEGTFTGDTQGLYGGTRNIASCDPKQMVTFLRQNPSKGQAWADTLGITPDMISDYVAKLTPVVLRSDTYVTNHGFTNGRATSFPALLQAGTAVLVNTYGLPVTKCYCGNPLTASPSRSARNYVGASWARFSPRRVTVVRPARTEIKVFTLVNPKKVIVFDRPVGTTGDKDTDSTAQRGSGPASGSITLDGSWRTEDNAVAMTIFHSGDQADFHWTLLNNSRGWAAGPRDETCSLPTSAVKIARVQLTCHTSEFPDDKWNIDLDITDQNHVTIPRDSHFFGPLSGTFVKTR